MFEFLRDPIWNGIAAIATIVSLIIVLFQSARSLPSKRSVDPSFVLQLVEGIKSNVRITQSIVRKIFWSMLFGLPALYISAAIYYVASVTEHDRNIWLTSGYLIIMLWMGPSRFQKSRTAGQGYWSVLICFFSALAYGTIGSYMFYHPNLWVDYSTPIRLLANFFSTTCRIGISFHAAESIYIPWYKSLPKE